MRRKDRELTDKAELLSILEEADVCKIAIQTGKAPYIVPLNFGYSWDENLVLYFHSATEGRKLDLLRKNNVVGFALDSGHELVKADLACNWGMKYKSLIGAGSILFIENDDEKKFALNRIMQKYGFESPVSHATREVSTKDAGFPPASLKTVIVFKLVVEEFSGKQKK